MRRPKRTRLCAAVKRNAERCRTAALSGSDFCYFHDPAIAAERRDSQASGGSRHRIRTLDSTAPDVQIERCADVVVLVTQTINQVRKGAIDPRIANAVGYLANVVIKAFEREDLETRIERLEELLENRERPPELNLTGK
jgi:hypothetical protein